MSGTLNYTSKEGITVINSRWVKADFEDGHISGSMLLEYKVLKDNEISWKVIGSYLDR